MVAIGVGHSYDLFRVAPYLVFEDVVFCGVPVVIAFSLRLVSSRICDVSKSDEHMGAIRSYSRDKTVRRRYFLWLIGM